MDLLMSKWYWMAHPDRALWNPRRSKRVNRVAINAGRRIGKTEHAMFTLVTMAEECPFDGEAWYAVPSYRQAKLIMWERINKWLDKQKVKLKRGQSNATELLIPLKSGRAIRLVGMDNEDSLRGAGCIGFVGDEWAMVKEHARFTNIIEVGMSDKAGPAIFYSTPRGAGQWKRLWHQGQPGPQHEAGWESFQFTTAEVGSVSPEMLKQMTTEMTADWYEQEYNAKFLDYTGALFPEFNPKEAPDGHVLPENNEDDYINLREGWKFNTMDAGFTDETCLLWWWVSPKGRAYIYDYYGMENATPENFKARVENSENARGQKRTVLQDLYGDPAMWQVDTGTGVSPATKYIRAGWNLRPAPRRPFMERVHALRKLMQYPSDTLLPGLMIVEHRASKLVSQLTLADDTWLKPNGQGFRNGLDVHALDALLYGSMIVQPSRATEVTEDDGRKGSKNPALHIQEAELGTAVATVGDPTDGTDGY
jgi:hypothetical protein